MVGLTSPVHIALVAVVLLLLFGAKRLPELGRSLGSGMREFRDSISGSPERTAAGQEEPARMAMELPPQGPGTDGRTDG